MEPQPLSRSQRAKREQFLDLRTRGYTSAEANAEVTMTDEAIIRERQCRRSSFTQERTTDDG